MVFSPGPRPQRGTCLACFRVCNFIWNSHSRPVERRRHPSDQPLICLEGSDTSACVAGRRLCRATSVGMRHYR
ncbi:hypothetical protein CSUI_009126 [Cystoisospora suis]|uniref:Uncharacterized protein n=1 Tax=Cystoisospora suis TaxID=483139 RepID=A0A2C6KKY5_9APIC|nr:hypothetical protein CSUI_009126 [Cystoisospora suis]